MDASHSLLTTKAVHQCNVCHKSFARASILREHQRSHTGEKPERCLKCGKGFARKNDAQRHEKTCGESQSAFSCDICHKSFTRRDTLKSHKASSHASSAEEGTGNRSNKRKKAPAAATTSQIPKRTKLIREDSRDDDYLHVPLDPNFGTPLEESPFPSGHSSSSAPKMHLNTATSEQSALPEKFSPGHIPNAGAISRPSASDNETSAHQEAISPSIIPIPENWLTESETRSAQVIDQTSPEAAEYAQIDSPFRSAQFVCKICGIAHSSRFLLLHDLIGHLKYYQNDLVGSADRELWRGRFILRRTDLLSQYGLNECFSSAKCRCYETSHDSCFDVDSEKACLHLKKIKANIIETLVVILYDPRFGFEADVRRCFWRNDFLTIRQWCISLMLYLLLRRSQIGKHQDVGPLGSGTSQSLVVNLRVVCALSPIGHRYTAPLDMTRYEAIYYAKRSEKERDFDDGMHDKGFMKLLPRLNWKGVDAVGMEFLSDTLADVCFDGRDKFLSKISCSWELLKAWAIIQRRVSRKP